MLVCIQPSGAMNLTIFVLNILGVLDWWKTATLGWTSPMLSRGSILVYTCCLFPCFFVLLASTGWRTKFHNSDPYCNYTPPQNIPKLTCPKKMLVGRWFISFRLLCDIAGSEQWSPGMMYFPAKCMVVIWNPRILKIHRVDFETTGNKSENGWLDC